MQVATPGRSGSSWPAIRIVLLSIALVAAFWLRLRLAAGVPAIENDGAFYARLAQEMLLNIGGHGFHPAWPDFFPRLTALATRFLFSASAGDMVGLADPLRVEFAARAVSAGAGALLLIPLFVMARRVAGEGAAWATLALTALHPRMLVFSGQALTEMLFGALVITALALAGWIRRARRPARALLAAGLAGAAAGAATLTRPEGVVVGAFVVIVTGLSARRSGRVEAAVAVAAALFLLVIGPRAMAVSGAIGRLSIGVKSDYNLAQAWAGIPGVPRLDGAASLYNNLPAPGRATHRFPEPVPPCPLAGVALHHPLAVIGHALRELPRSLGALPSLAGWPWVLLALAGLFARRGRLTAEEKSWAALWAGFVMMYALVFVYRRFFAAFLPLLILEAGAGLAWLAAPPAAAPMRGLRRAAALLLLVTAAAWGPHDAPRLLARETTPGEQKEVGRRLARDDSRSTLLDRLTGPGLMARRPVAAWYAGRPILALPDEPPDSLAATAARRGAGWVLLIEADLARDRPRLLPLLSPATAPPGLKLLQSDETPGKAWKLYRVE